MICFGLFRLSNRSLNIVNINLCIAYKEDTHMTHFDLTPLFRSTVGFDHLSRLMDNAFETSQRDAGYPPYNIEKHDDDTYRITMAVAGFSDEDIEITAQDNQLIVTANGKNDETKGDIHYLHRGIAKRAFEQRFHLADHIRVTDAAMDNGLLHIDLVREVPEHMKPRKINITGGKKLGKLLEGRKSKKAS